ncbi:MAG: protein kinase, partial [Gemmatimonadota bacterium]
MSAPKLGDDWWRLASLVDALLDAPPERRPALIEELSGGDPARRIELEGLLQECDREPAMLSRPAPDRFAALFDGEVSFPSALAERYRLTRELGHGGMATVYLARDVKHGRDVAVKVVHPALASALGADRFLREIEIVAQLHHPHIVPLYDSGAVDGTLYYVMPYETGLSLRQRLTRDGPLPPEDVVIILRDVCDALADAHAHGIVHRDIKPDNVLLSGRHAMVTDFGVATAADSSATGSTSPTGLLLGTPAYMAPEQISAGSRVDHRADIYAVGVLAYELLAGELPFRGDTPEALLSAHLTTVPVPIATRRPETPAPLADLVMRCLEKQPADRWQAADEMIQRLDTLAIARSGPSPADQRRWRVPALAVAFVALSAFAAFAWWRAERSSVSWPDRWSRARIERLTDFPGSEVDAAISRDGRSVAFLADRDSVFDAFVGRVGSGQWVNLTNGRLPELFNEDVGNVGFTADAANVWLRVAEIGSPATVSLVAANGGPIHPFLPTAVMAAWSPDGSRLAYHETTPGDPIYVATADGRNPQRIYVADPGIHNHHLSWSPDGRFLYFTHGVPPGEMDVWRVPSTGGGPERITSVNSRVAYPLLIDERTL